MTNINFQSVPAQAWANNQSGHYYSTELISWFRASGQPADYPNAFTPDIGSKYDFTVTHDASAYNYIYDKTDPFWPAEGNFDKGFSVQSPEISSSRQFNYRIAGGKGHWMPAPIFRSLSFYWGNESNNAKSWYIKHTALVLKNWKTDEEKTYGFGMNTTNKGSRVVIFNTVDEVRAMGPDWFVYGVIFNLRTDATSDLLIGKGKLVDFRLGYECARPAGTNRLILPKQMTWGNFTSAMRAGQMKYEPASTTSGPEIEYFRHTLDSPHTLCLNTSVRYNLQWKVLGDTTCVIKHSNGYVYSTAQSGDMAINLSELATIEYIMEATGSNGVVETRRISATTVCALPTNSLSGPSSSTYGTSYTLNYTQSNFSRGDLAGSSVYNSVGSKTYTRYPTKEITYCSTLESYNCCGSKRATHCVKVPGFSVAPVSIGGVPSQPKKKDEFTVTPSYGNSSKLKNVEYKWELESGIDSGFANFDGNAAGRPGLFESTDRTPLIYVINNTHSKSGNAVSQPPGKLPDGVKLKLTVTNKDNNETSSSFVYFKTYPK